MKQTVTSQLEIKSLSDREFEGHGSIFRNVDYGGDIVVPGAFRKTLAEHKAAGQLPQLFWMHRPDMVPGKWLEMSEDKDGLYVKGVFADTQLGRETRTLLKMDAVRGLSIGYYPTDIDFDKEGNKLIKEADLIEVSVVSLPMNPLAVVSAAKFGALGLSENGEYIPPAQELEHVFRRMGCSKSVSRRLVWMIHKDESGETLDESRCDAEDVDDELASALEKLRDREIAGLIR